MRKFSPVRPYPNVHPFRHHRSGGCLRALRHSSKRCTTTKIDGANSTARQVEAIIPLNTVMPIDLRALAPAPLATTRGATPRMNANNVMMIGRNRARAASTAASMMDLFPFRRVIIATDGYKMLPTIAKQMS